MQLLLEHHRRLLLDNGARSAGGEDIDPYPVVKLTWMRSARRMMSSRVPAGQALSNSSCLIERYARSPTVRAFGAEQNIDSGTMRRDWRDKQPIGEYIRSDQVTPRRGRRGASVAIDMALTSANLALPAHRPNRPAQPTPATERVGQSSAGPTGELIIARHRGTMVRVGAKRPMIGERELWPAPRR